MIKLTRHQVTPFIISLSFFMEAVDSTVLNTAIPAIARSLSVDPVDLKVALISYLLSLAIFIPISGWLADKFGSKKVYITSLIFFTFSSLWCGFTHNLTELVIARFVQGFGGALGLPVGRLILIRTFGRQNLVANMSRVIMLGALGLMLGPVIGGFITHYFSWHWIFWVNVPVGIIAMLLAIYWLLDEKPQPAPRLDKIGFIFFGSALAGFTFGLSALSESSTNHSMALSIILLSILLLIAYFFYSRRKAHPIVKISLLHIRTFRISITANLISRLGFGGVPFLVPLLLQVCLNYPAQISGLLLAPTALGILLVKPFSLRLLRFFGYKQLLMLNTFCAGFSIWLFAFVDLHTSFYVIGFLTFVYGFMMSLQFSAMNSLAYADILPEDFSAATSIMSTMQQVSQSIGVAVSALSIRFFSSYFSDHTLLTPQIIHYTFFTIGFFTLLSAFIFIPLKPEDGQQLI